MRGQSTWWADTGAGGWGPLGSVWLSKKEEMLGSLRSKQLRLEVLAVFLSACEKKENVLWV